MLDAFYTTVAQASFTLLALWWVLLQIRHDQWMTDPYYRQGVYDISFYFLLAGMMSLTSLLAGDDTSVWEVSFAIFGIVGVIESVLVLRRRSGTRVAGPLMLAGDVLSVALYAMVALVAIWPGEPERLGIDLEPLKVEGILVAALILLGVVLASAIFMTTGPEDARAQERTSRTSP